jgi:hypothetical protein
VETKKRGMDALGTRYQRVDLLNGIEVMVLVTDNAAFTDDQDLRSLVEMAAYMALEELRQSVLPQVANV